MNEDQSLVVIQSVIERAIAAGVFKTMQDVATAITAYNRIVEKVQQHEDRSAQQ